MLASLQPVQERWNSFLVKIEERFHETLSQAQAILPQVLELQDFNTTPIGVAWQGIHNQAMELIGKVSDTWSEKVSSALEEIKESEAEKRSEAGGSMDEFYREFYELYYNEQSKGIELCHRLEKELKKYEVKTFAEAGRKLQQKAREVLSKGFNCTQCQAPLPVQQNFFRSYYQTCDYCQTTNTFEPGTIGRNVEHFALHPIAEEQALNEYFTYWDLEREYKQQREDEPKTISAQHVLDAYARYLDIYLKARIAIIPEYEKRFKKDRAARLEQLRKWTLSDDFARDFTFLSKQQIEDIFYQIVNAFFYLEQVKRDQDTPLNSLNDFLEWFNEEIEDAFGLALPNPEQMTIQNAIDWLYDHRDQIKLGWTVSMNLEWYGWFDYDDEDDEEII